MPHHTDRAPVDFAAPEEGLSDFARRKLHLTRTALHLKRPLGPYRPLQTARIMLFWAD